MEVDSVTPAGRASGADVVPPPQDAAAISDIKQPSRTSAFSTPSAPSLEDIEDEKTKRAMTALLTQVQYVRKSMVERLVLLRARMRRIDEAAKDVHQLAAESGTGMFAEMGLLAGAGGGGAAASKQDKQDNGNSNPSAGAGSKSQKQKPKHIPSVGHQQSQQSKRRTLSDEILDAGQDVRKKIVDVEAALQALLRTGNNKQAGGKTTFQDIEATTAHAKTLLAELGKKLVIPGEVKGEKEMKTFVDALTTAAAGASKAKAKAKAENGGKAKAKAKAGGGGPPSIWTVLQDHVPLLKAENPTWELLQGGTSSTPSYTTLAALSSPQEHLIHQQELLPPTPLSSAAAAASTDPVLAGEAAAGAQQAENMIKPQQKKKPKLSPQERKAIELREKEETDRKAWRDLSRLLEKIVLKIISKHLDRIEDFELLKNLKEETQKLVKHDRLFLDLLQKKRTTTSKAAPEKIKLEFLQEEFEGRSKLLAETKQLHEKAKLEFFDQQLDPLADLHEQIFAGMEKKTQEGEGSVGNRFFFIWRTKVQLAKKWVEEMENNIDFVLKDRNIVLEIKELLSSRDNDSSWSGSDFDHSSDTCSTVDSVEMMTMQFGQMSFAAGGDQLVSCEPGNKATGSSCSAGNSNGNGGGTIVDSAAAAGGQGGTTSGKKKKPGGGAGATPASTSQQLQTGAALTQQLLQQIPVITLDRLKKTLQIVDEAQTRLRKLKQLKSKEGITEKLRGLAEKAHQELKLPLKDLERGVQGKVEELGSKLKSLNISVELPGTNITTREAADVQEQSAQQAAQQAQQSKKKDKQQRPAQQAASLQESSVMTSQHPAPSAQPKTKGKTKQNTAFLAPRNDTATLAGAFYHEPAPVAEPYIPEMKEYPELGAAVTASVAQPAGTIFGRRKSTAKSSESSPADPEGNEERQPVELNLPAGVTEKKKKQKKKKSKATDEAVTGSQTNATVEVLPEQPPETILAGRLAQLSLSDPAADKTTGKIETIIPDKSASSVRADEAGPEQQLAGEPQVVLATMSDHVPIVSSSVPAHSPKPPAVVRPILTTPHPLPKTKSKTLLPERFLATLLNENHLSEKQHQEIKTVVKQMEQFLFVTFDEMFGEDSSVFLQTEEDRVKLSHTRLHFRNTMEYRKQMEYQLQLLESEKEMNLQSSVTNSNPFVLGGAARAGGANNAKPNQQSPSEINQRAAGSVLLPVGAQSTSPGPHQGMLQPSSSATAPFALFEDLQPIDYLAAATDLRLKQQQMQQAEAASGTTTPTGGKRRKGKSKATATGQQQQQQLSVDTINLASQAHDFADQSGEMIPVNKIRTEKCTSSLELSKKVLDHLPPEKMKYLHMLLIRVAQGHYGMMDQQQHNPYNPNAHHQKWAELFLWLKSLNILYIEEFLLLVQRQELKLTKELYSSYQKHFLLLPKGSVAQETVVAKHFDLDLTLYLNDNRGALVHIWRKIYTAMKHWDRVVLDVTKSERFEEAFQSVTSFRFLHESQSPSSFTIDMSLVSVHELVLENSSSNDHDKIGMRSKCKISGTSSTPTTATPLIAPEAYFPLYPQLALAMQKPGDGTTQILNPLQQAVEGHRKVADRDVLLKGLLKKLRPNVQQTIILAKRWYKERIAVLGDSTTGLNSISIAFLVLYTLEKLWEAGKIDHRLVLPEQPKAAAAAGVEFSPVKIPKVDSGFVIGVLFYEFLGVLAKQFELFTIEGMRLKLRLKVFRSGTTRTSDGPEAGNFGEAAAEGTFTKHQLPYTFDVKQVEKIQKNPALQNRDANQAPFFLIDPDSINKPEDHQHTLQLSDQFYNTATAEIGTVAKITTVGNQHPPYVAETDYVQKVQVAYTSSSARTTGTSGTAGAPPAPPTTRMQDHDIEELTTSRLFQVKQGIPISGEANNVGVGHQSTGLPLFVVVTSSSMQDHHTSLTMDHIHPGDGISTTSVAGMLGLGSVLQVFSLTRGEELHTDILPFPDAVKVRVVEAVVPDEAGTGVMGTATIDDGSAHGAFYQGGTTFENAAAPAGWAAWPAATAAHEQATTTTTHHALNPAAAEFQPGQAIYQHPQQEAELLAPQPKMLNDQLYGVVGWVARTALEKFVKEKEVDDQDHFLAGTAGSASSASLHYLQQQRGRNLVRAKFDFAKFRQMYLHAMTTRGNILEFFATQSGRVDVVADEAAVPPQPSQGDLTASQILENQQQAFYHSIELALELSPPYLHKEDVAELSDFKEFQGLNERLGGKLLKKWSEYGKGIHVNPVLLLREDLKKMELNEQQTGGQHQALPAPAAYGAPVPHDSAEGVQQRDATGSVLTSNRPGDEELYSENDEELDLTEGVDHAAETAEAIEAREIAEGFEAKLKAILNPPALPHGGVLRLNREMTLNNPRWRFWTQLAKEEKSRVEFVKSCKRDYGRNFYPEVVDDGFQAAEDNPFCDDDGSEVEIAQHDQLVTPSWGFRLHLLSQSLIQSEEGVRGSCHPDSSTEMALLRC
ncbi:unnamed protein product [Amoebophrya sp. A120]|nr:unnamed protein product [Amoebophrya sp. A120]|eukprot:GSA120T00009021001.1